MDCEPQANTRANASRTSKEAFSLTDVAAGYHMWLMSILLVSEGLDLLVSPT